jgi:hypothetical protein
LDSEIIGLPRILPFTSPGHGLIGHRDCPAESRRSFPLEEHFTGSLPTRRQVWGGMLL